MEDTSVLGQYRRVAYVEEFYSIVHDIHERGLLHAGYKKTFEKVGKIIQMNSNCLCMSVCDFIAYTTCMLIYR